MKLATSVFVSVLLLALAGCGSSSSSSSTPASSAPTGSASASGSSSPSASTGGASGTVHVVMKNLAFNPVAVHAKVGQTVQWVNEDTPPHNVMYVSGPKFTSSSTLDTGAKYSVKLTQPGTIHYFCSIHPFMKATIVVTK